MPKDSNLDLRPGFTIPSSPAKASDLVTQGQCANHYTMQPAVPYCSTSQQSIIMVVDTGIEPVTNALSRHCSTAELIDHMFGETGGARTHNLLVKSQVLYH